MDVFVLLQGEVKEVPSSSMLILPYLEEGWVYSYAIL